MKYLIILSLILTAVIACNPSAGKNEPRQNHAHRPETKQEEAYKPGFGSLMISVQVHHAKLWFAGINKNWRLAGFEIHEIEESLDDIRNYKRERKETQMLGVLDPVMDSIHHAVGLEDTALFKKSYALLTNTCNSCHRASGYDFMVIKIPDQPPFTNQDFRLQRSNE